MPNHITNVLRFTAYEHQGVPAGLITKILSAIKGKDTPIDFNRVIPMPVELHITSGSVTSNALALSSVKEAKSMLGWPWVTDAGVTDVRGLRALLRKQYKAHPEKGFPTLDDFAARVKSNIKKHGAATWYDWCCDKWGTKWNAYEATVGVIGKRKREAVLHFETAWAPPLPVIDAIAAKFPKACIRLIWCDEGSDKQHRVYWESGKRENDEASS